MLRLKQLRTENNMSQRALAKKINVSQKAIDLWEKEITEPKSSIIILLSNVFECSADYLLGRGDDFGTVNVMRDLSDEEKQIFIRLFKTRQKATGRA